MKNYRTIFELAWTWYEDYTPFLFFHRSKSKTQEGFKADVKRLFKKYGNDYLKQETGWAGAQSWTEFVAGKLPTLGYTRIHTKTYRLWGAYIIEKGHENDSYYTEKEGFGKIIGKRLLKKAFIHNRNLRRRHRRRKNEHKS